MDGEPENTIPTYCQAKLCNISELCKFSIGLERTAKEVYKTTKFAVTSLKRDGETEKTGITYLVNLSRLKAGSKLRLLLNGNLHLSARTSSSSFLNAAFFMPLPISG